MVTICTASLTFNNSTFCPHTVFMCFVWIWEQTAVISLCNFNGFVYIVYAKLWKATISFQSVRPSACNNSSPTTRIFKTFHIWESVEDAPRKFKLHSNLTTITCTLHEDRYTFVIISRSVLLRMRNVSDRSYRENQNTHFVFSDFFPKIVPFMR